MSQLVPPTSITSTQLTQLITQTIQSGPSSGGLSGLYVPVPGAAATGTPTNTVIGAYGTGRRSMWITPNSTTSPYLIASGNGGLTVTGAATISSTNDIDGLWGSTQPAAQGHNIVYCNTFAGLQHGPYMQTVFRAHRDASGVGVRFYIGLSDTQTFISADSSLGINFIGVRYSQPAGDTGWVPVVNKGTGTILSVGPALYPFAGVATTVALALTISVTLTSEGSPGFVTWTMNGGTPYVVPYSTTTFPVGSILMGPIVSSQGTGATSTPYTDVGKIYVEAN